MNINDFIYKTNSPELTAYFEQYGKQFYIDADEINSIVDTLKLMSNNVASSGFIEKNAHGFTGQNYIIAPFSKWAIDNSLYSNLSQVTLVVPYSASGKTRYERIAATTENTFIRVIGAESSSAAVLPDLPTETLELTRYIVRDNAIDAPTPVEPTGVYVEKATYTPLTLNSVGEVGSLEMDKRAAIKAVGALTRLGNIIKNNSTHHFPGQLFVFIDDTPDGGVELPHLYTAGGSGSIAWFHPDGQDYVTQQKEVVLFVEDLIGSQKVNRRISTSLKNKSVTLEKMQDVPSGSFYARNSAGTGQPELLDVFDVLLMLGLENVVTNLALKQNPPIVTTTNDTGLKGEVHHNIGNNTYTDDPVPVAGKGYYVNNISGTATVNGVGYKSGSYISRMYDGSSWKTSVLAEKNLIFQDTTIYTHTGTTSRSKITELVIPANTIKDGDIWELDSVLSRGATGASNCTLFFQLQENIPENGFIRNCSLSGAHSRARFKRALFFKDGNVRKLSNSGSFYSDIGTFSNAPSGAGVESINMTIEQKLSVHIQLSNSSDTTYLEYIVFKKIN